MIFADTSFLISLYGQDVNTPAANQRASAHASPIYVNSVNEYEFANALRLLVFRHKITAASRQVQMLAYEADKKAGKIVFCQSNTNDVFTKVESLSFRHTERLGNRAYDILQVAAAKLLGVTDFWSFDSRQRQLAAAEGMNVGP
jgi:predicted nucleic acid-binding protein